LDTNNDILYRLYITGFKQKFPVDNYKPFLFRTELLLSTKTPFLYSAVILCFCSFVWGLKEAQEPYVGEGVLCQLPPTLYKGGVIDIQHPSLLSGPDPSFFSKEHIIKTSPGWKTKFVVERLQLSGSITDSVEVTIERRHVAISHVDLKYSKISYFTYSGYL